jgi:hypothetical protein
MDLGRGMKAGFGAVSKSAAKFVHEEAPLYIAVSLGAAAGLLTGYAARALFHTAANNIVSRVGVDLPALAVRGPTVPNIIDWSAGSIGIVSGIALAASSAYLLHQMMKPDAYTNDCKTCARSKLAANFVSAAAALCVVGLATQGLTKALAYFEPTELARKMVEVVNVPMVGYSISLAALAAYSASRMVASQFARNRHPTPQP